MPSNQCIPIWRGRQKKQKRVGQYFSSWNHWNLGTPHLRLAFDLLSDGKSSRVAKSQRTIKTSSAEAHDAHGTFQVAGLALRHRDYHFITIWSGIPGTFDTRTVRLSDSQTVRLGLLLCLLSPLSRLSLATKSTWSVWSILNRAQVLLTKAAANDDIMCICIYIY
jgi:hypothetical protein